MITIADGNPEKNLTLSIKPQPLVAKKSEIKLIFANGTGSKDVYFWSEEPTSITFRHKLKHWQCGFAKEDARCANVHRGHFYWGGTYTVRFGGKIVQVFLYISAHDLKTFQ